MAENRTVAPASGDEESASAAYLLPRARENERVVVGQTFASQGEVARGAVGGKCLKYRNCRFLFPLHLEVWRDFEEVTFEWCRFLDHVEGSKVHFKGAVFFLMCSFKRSLTLAEAHFEKGLSVAFSALRMEEPPQAAKKPTELADYDEAPDRRRSAWWPGLRVTGMLRLDRTVFGGSLNLAEARIDGPLMMRSISVGIAPRKNSTDGRGRGRLHLRQVRITSDLLLSPHTAHREFVHATSSFVKGSVVLAGAFVEGKVDLRGMRIEGRLHMPHAHVRDRLDAELWRSASDHDAKRLLRTRIGQRRGVAVRLADAEIGHGVWLDGAQLGGQLNAKNVKVGGDFYFREPFDYPGNRPYLRTQAPPASAVLPSEPKEDQDSQRKRTEAIRMTGARIDGSFDVTGAEFVGTLNLENIRVGGDLLGCGALLRKKRDVEEPTDSVNLHGGHVGRTLDFRGAHISGAIMADSVIVLGDVRCGSWERAGREAAEYSDVIDISNAGISGALEISFGTYHGFSASGIQVRHEASLCGVHKGEVNFIDARIEGRLAIGKLWNATSAVPPTGRTEFEKAVRLDRAHIDGDVECCKAQFNKHLNLVLARVGGAWKHQHENGGEAKAPAEKIASVPCHVSVKGDLKAESVTVADSFDLRTTAVEGEIDLSCARLGELRLGLDRDRGALPGKVLLSDAEIGRLFVESKDLPFEQPPFMEMQGLRFGELEVSGLRAKPVADEDDPLGAIGRFKWRLFHWALPAPTELAVAFIITLCCCIVLWLQHPRAALWFGIAALVACVWRVVAVHSRGSLARDALDAGVVFVLYFTVLGCLFTRDSSVALVACVVCGFFLLGRVYNSFTRERRTLDPYPSRERLFLMQMVEMDAGVYARTEAWLRNHGRHEEADRVYLNRRMRELENGLLAWYFHFRRHQKQGDLRARLRALYSAGWRGRPAILHPQAIEKAVVESERAIKATSVKDPEGHAEIARLKKRAWQELWRRASRTPQRLVEWALFMFVGDGGRVAPAVILWSSTLLFATFCIYRDPGSVERRATFVAERDLRADVREREDAHKPYWRETMGDAEREDWGRMDAFWMALNSQLPFADFTAREKWTASSERTRFFVDLGLLLREELPATKGLLNLRWVRAPRYDTLTGFFQIWGWLTVPVILGSITGLLRRRPAEVEHESKHE